MHRIDDTGNVAGMFTEGNPSIGEAPTKVTDDWLNDVQENLCDVVESPGGTLVKGTYTQLRTGINALALTVANTAITALKAATNTWSGANTFSLDVTVDSAHDFLFSAAKSQTAHVAAMDFQVDKAYVTLGYWNQATYNNSDASPNPGSNLASMSASLYDAGARIALPKGAIVTGVKALAINNHASNAYNLTLGLVHLAYSSGGGFTRTRLDSGAGASVGLAVSVPANTSSWTWVDVGIVSSLSAPTDGMTYCFLRMPQTAVVNNVFFGGLRISYTIAKVATSN